MTIREIYDKEKDFIGKNILLRIRCYTVRMSGRKDILFVHGFDGSTVRTLQFVFHQRKLEYDNDLSWDDICDITRSCVITLEGQLIESPANGQDYEFDVTKVIYVGKIIDPGSYPLSSRGHIPINTLHTYPHLCGQHPFYLSVQIIKQTLMFSIHNTMRKHNIGEVKPTLLTTSECEEGAHPFTVTTLPLDTVDNIPVVEGTNKVDISKDFFGKPTYLTVSSQLQLEANVISTCRDCYIMTIAFRAEPSKTPMHMAEFLMMEWECIGDMKKTMLVGEDLIKDCIESVLKECYHELEFVDNYIRKDVEHNYTIEKASLKKRKSNMSKQEYVTLLKQLENTYNKQKSREPQIELLKRYLSQSFAYTTHEECVRQMLDDIKNEKVTFDKSPGYNDDLSREHERYISRVLYPNSPGVFVQNLPEHIKAFYMPKVREESDIAHAECFDYIGKFGEIIGGSARIHDYEELDDKITQFGMKHEPLEWYKETIKYGCFPHAGAGIGFSRLFMEITGLESARLSEEFLRAAGHSIFA